jgi:hypothetical protein
MSALHIAISVGLVVCAFGAFGGMAGWSPPEYVGLSIYVGYLLGLVAVMVAFVNLILIGVRAFSGGARDKLRRSWLSLVNGGASVAFAVLAIQITGQQ